MSGMAMTARERKAIENRFHLQYGRTLAAWTEVEFWLAHWFAELSGAPFTVAQAIFFSGRNFTPVGT